jgi:thiamine-monophosphate kinase
LNLCITVMGEVTAALALRRDAAKVGDDLWVSHPKGGGLGDARLALEAFRGQVHLGADAFKAARLRMERPEPRLALGQALLGIAHAAIDVSDGLVGDLGHVLKASRVGATLAVDDLPMSNGLRLQPLALQRLCTLTGGDDYELVFTAPRKRRVAVRAAAAKADVKVTRIGSIDGAPGLRLVDAKQRVVLHHEKAFDHFAVATTTSQRP